MSEIKLKDILYKKNILSYDYQVSADLNEYFNSEELMFIEYDYDMTDIPKSIGVIPFVCNVLPIIWICNATLVLEELDFDFYENIENIKKGYMAMYPKIKFKGNLVVKQIIKNDRLISDKVGCMFSGGVDAFSTLYDHLYENPILITIWGSDIKLTDIVGWSNVKSHTMKIAKEYKINCSFVKSNFRTFINENKLNQLIYDNSKESWWHGFQHGIGLLGFTSLIAYQYGLKKIYIASTFTEQDKGKVTCASDPTIDNYVSFCNCKVIHDGYEKTRQNKIQNIVKSCGLMKKKAALRVCWESSGGENCCHCEKCYRTIMGLIVEGVDPNDYGFSVDEEVLGNMRVFMEDYILGPILLPLWKDIQNRALVNKELLYKKELTDWICKIDLKNTNISILIKKTRKKIRRFIR